MGQAIIRGYHQPSSDLPEWTVVLGDLRTAEPLCVALAHQPCVLSPCSQQAVVWAADAPCTPEDTAGPVSRNHRTLSEDGVVLGSRVFLPESFQRGRPDAAGGPRHRPGTNSPGGLLVQGVLSCLYKDRKVMMVRLVKLSAQFVLLSSPSHTQGSPINTAPQITL
ncbi:unnamed protein product [Lota lota]